MSTARDLVKGSLRLLGVIASGETPSASEASDALSAANQMLQGWAVGGLIVPNSVREEFTLVPGTNSYTLGTGGVFNTTRPIRIDSVTLEDQSNSPTVEYPVRMLNHDEWSNIPMKDQSSTYPTMCYFTGAFPLDTVHVYPAPSAANKLVIYSQKLLTALSLDTEVALPPGYDRALRYNFAVEFAPEYGKAVSPEIAAIALESKEMIMRNNSKPLYLVADDATRGRRYDIFQGE